MKSDVVVIGSLNYDILVQQDRLPELGETFTGNELMLMPWEGANQAVQCSRLGLNVSMVGCVGNDIYGSELINSLRENNVSVENVNKRGTTTGIGIVQILNQVTTAAPLSKALITLSVKMTSLSHSSKDSHWLFFSQKFRPRC